MEFDSGIWLETLFWSGPKHDQPWDFIPQLMTLPGPVANSATRACIIRFQNPQFNFLKITNSNYIFQRIPKSKFQISKKIKNSKSDHIS